MACSCQFFIRLLRLIGLFKRDNEDSRWTLWIIMRYARYTHPYTSQTTPIQRLLLFDWKTKFITNEKCWSANGIEKIGRKKKRNNIFISIRWKKSSILHARSEYRCMPWKSKVITLKTGIDTADNGLFFIAYY